MCAKKKMVIDSPIDEYGFKIVAISSPLKPNNLLWNLNDQLGANLTRCNKADFANIAIFTDSTSHYPAILSLIPKASFDDALGNKMKNIDFIMEITGKIDAEKFTLLLKRIKQTTGILVATEIQPSSIKRKMPFYLE